MNILSTTYFGNVQYFSKLFSGEPFIIDVHENYVKQSFRTRCDIMAAGGVVSLTVPVLKNSGEKTATRDTRIDNSKKWQHQHRMSIVSAYRNSPYFEYFEEDVLPIFDRRYEFLLDLNNDAMEIVFGLLGHKPELLFSEKYSEPASGDVDLRNCMSPKPRLHQADPCFEPVPYYQVFSDKFDFVPNLSVLDLLFCEGGGALSVIEQSII